MNSGSHFRSKKAWLVLAAPLVIAAGAAAVLPALTHQAAVDAAPAKAVDPAEMEAAVADAEGLSKAFRFAAQKVQPAVVMIQRTAAVPVDSSGEVPGDLFGHSPFGKRFGEIPELKRFFDQLPRTPMPQQQGMGSGVIVDPSGVILTNNHVVEGGGKIVVRLHDGREFEAEKVTTDPQTDLAVVRIKGAKNLQYARLGDSDEMYIGDWVLALGHPFGLEGSVTAGIISAKGRGIGITAREDFLQTDAAINPGNSGGPLVNLRGEVIGINTAISSRTGGNNGVGFAIPINLAKWVTDQLIADGSVHRAHLGVVIQPVTQELAEMFGVKTHGGALVAQVQDDSPAAAAGLKTGDVIVAFNGKPVTSPRELQLLVERTTTQDKTPLAVMRDGKRIELEVKLRESINDDLAAADVTATHRDKMGLELGELTPEVAKQLGVEGVDGVVITSVEPGSRAAEAGLTSGDVIVRVNRRPVASMSEFRDAMKQGDTDKGTLLLVRSERGSRFVVIPPAGE